MKKEFRIKTATAMDGQKYVVNTDYANLKELCECLGREDYNVTDILEGQEESLTEWYILEFEGDFNKVEQECTIKPWKWIQ